MMGEDNRLLLVVLGYHTSTVAHALWHVEACTTLEINKMYLLFIYQVQNEYNEIKIIKKHVFYIRLYKNIEKIYRQF